MIVVNGKEIIVEHFPDGTQNIKFPSGIGIHGFLSTAQVQWLYDSDEEIFTLFSVVDWINRVLPIGAKFLQMLRTNWKNSIYPIHHTEQCKYFLIRII